jgi:hypothetical protein
MQKPAMNPGNQHYRVPIHLLFLQLNRYIVDKLLARIDTAASRDIGRIIADSKPNAAIAALSDERKEGIHDRENRVGRADWSGSRCFGLGNRARYSTRRMVPCWAARRRWSNSRTIPFAGNTKA